MYIHDFIPVNPGIPSHVQRRSGRTRPYAGIATPAKRSFHGLSARKGHIRENGIQPYCRSVFFRHQKVALPYPAQTGCSCGSLMRERRREEHTLYIFSVGRRQGISSVAEGPDEMNSTSRKYLQNTVDPFVFPAITDCRSLPYIKHDFRIQSDGNRNRLRHLLKGSFLHLM